MWKALSGLVLVLVSWASAQAAAPSEKYLPNTTVGFFAAPNVQKLVEQWKKTQLGQLAADPVMQPFVKDLQRQIDERWGGLQQRLGLSIDDIRGLAKGEAALAVIQPGGKKDQVATALLIDVTGNLEQAQKVLAKVAENYARRGAKKSQAKASGVQLTVFDLPKQEQDPQVDRAVYFLSDNLLGAADDQKVLEDVVARVRGQKNGDALADFVPFQAVIKRVKQDEGEATPHVRWFLQPFGYAEAMRAAHPEREKRKGKTMLQTLQDVGFTAIQGVGGYADLAVDAQTQILHRTAIYAPKPYQKSMQMMVFPNRKEFKPQPWVPRDVAAYTTFYADVLTAFDHLGPLFDALFGEGETGVWSDVLDSLKTDPNGPQIDLRKDLIAKLTGRASVVRMYHVPITTSSERLLYAIEASDPKAVAAAMEKSVKDDKTMRQRQFEQFTVWETIPPKKAEVPQIKLELPGLETADQPQGRAPKRGQQGQRAELLPNMAITVAYDHLLVASHYDFLVEILKQADERNSLARAVEYQQVTEALKKLGAGENALWSFSRMDEAIRPTYELIREGKMPQSESMLGRVLNTMFAAGKQGAPRKQEIDGSKMPEFEVVRPYLGPAGSYLTSEADGWFFKGVLLTK